MRTTFFQLMAVDNGQIRYCILAGADKAGVVLKWASSKSPFCIPHRFDTEGEAKAYWEKWRDAHPATAQEWIPRITEVEE